MVDKFIYSVALSTDNPKEPERVFFVADDASEVFDVIAHNDDYFKRFVSVDVVALCKSI